MPDGSPWPRVSVVTPSYNQGQFIEETMRSVLLQGYPNLEYIVVDGGSMDGSVEIIRKYEPWLAYWVSEPDQGQSDAINKGWRRATGEIVAWLNSDDIYLSGTVGAASTALMQSPEVAVVYGNYQQIDGEGELIKVGGASREFDLRRLLWTLSSYIPQPSAFIRRSVLEDVGLLDATLHYSMDYDLWLRIGVRYPLRYVEEVWSAARMHTDAKTVARQGEIWKGKEKVLRAAMASPYMPADLEREAPALYSAYYFRVARIVLRQGDFADALRYLKRAIVTRPTIALQWQTWGRLLATLWRLARYGSQSSYWPTAQGK
jgi:glycosyltransferase involved in cell wall biosynthesis